MLDPSTSPTGSNPASFTSRNSPTDRSLVKKCVLRISTRRSRACTGRSAGGAWSGVTRALESGIVTPCEGAHATARARGRVAGRETVRTAPRAHAGEGVPRADDARARRVLHEGAARDRDRGEGAPVPPRRVRQAPEGAACAARARREAQGRRARA